MAFSCTLKYMEDSICRPDSLTTVFQWLHGYPVRMERSPSHKELLQIQISAKMMSCLTPAERWERTTALIRSSDAQSNPSRILVDCSKGFCIFIYTQSGRPPTAAGIHFAVCQPTLDILSKHKYDETGELLSTGSVSYWLTLRLPLSLTCSRFSIENCSLSGILSIVVSTEGPNVSFEDKKSSNDLCMKRFSNALKECFPLLFSKSWQHSYSSHPFLPREKCHFQHDLKYLLELQEYFRWPLIQIPSHLESLPPMSWFAVPPQYKKHISSQRIDVLLAINGDTMYLIN